jgi:hypothetical protein
MSENSLWKITEQLEIIEQMFMESEGELTPEIEAKQQEIEHLLVHKTDACVKFLRKQDGMIEAAKKEKKFFEDYIRTRENMKKNFEGYLWSCIKKSKRKEGFSGSLFSIKLRKAAKVVKITDEKSLPERFTEYIPASTKILTNELKSALKNEEIKGAELVDSEAKSIQLGVAK